MEWPQYFQAFIALIFVLALMGILSLIAKRFQPNAPRGKSKRLSLTEVMMIDSRTKAVLLRRDDKEHLVIIGQNGDTEIIESGLDSPKADDEDDPKPI